ncbi:MAG: class I SAM-dependent methyltransferase [Hymenobacter sp.]|nr:MAG: class I SAM-dependent methyltransferase [Hymenobacter sp.]
MTIQAALPADFVVVRGQTQKDVNRTVLTTLVNRFPADAALRVLDLPCGNLEFLSYVARLFPKATLSGADITAPAVANPAVSFVKMDLTKDFQLPDEPSFDLITSISGVMMFGNTLSFVRNCAARLKPGGTLVITNDNSATIIDKVAYLLFGRYRLFKPIYEDTEELTQYVPLPELCRLLRTHGVAIEQIAYTSFYRKDLLLLPLALLIYPIQKYYLRRLPTQLPPELIAQMYPFKGLFGKHYIITGRKAA